MNILKHNEAKEWAKNSLQYPKQESFALLQRFFETPYSDDLGLIYGLPYTGLTTLFQQAISLVDDILLFQVEPNDIIEDIRNIIPDVPEKYIFIYNFTELDFTDTLARSLVNGFAYKHKFLLVGKHSFVFDELINGVLLDKHILFATDNKIIQDVSLKDFLHFALFKNLHKLRSLQKIKDLEIYASAVLINETLRLQNESNVSMDKIENVLNKLDLSLYVINYELNPKIYNKIRYIYIRSKILQVNKTYSSDGLLFQIEHEFIRDKINEIL